MNLHDPARPSTAGRPAFLGGTAIPELRVWPLPDSSSYAIKLMLPIQGEGLGCMWFQATFQTSKHLLYFLSNFREDPEGTLESLFCTSPFLPSLRYPSTAPSSLSSQQSIDDLGL